MHRAGFESSLGHGLKDQGMDLRIDCLDSIPINFSKFYYPAQPKKLLNLKILQYVMTQTLRAILLPR